MYKYFSWIVVILTSVNLMAEPMAYNRDYKYERVQIVSCETSEKAMSKKAEFRNYSSANRNKLLESSKYLTILDVIPLFEVELITSVYNGNTKNYLGKVTPIPNAKKVKLHMQWASCENYEKNKEVIFSISSGYNCGRDIFPDGYQETNAACLVDYELAHEVSVGEYR